MRFALASQSPGTRPALPSELTNVRRSTGEPADPSSAHRCTRLVVAAIMCRKSVPQIWFASGEVVVEASCKLDTRATFHLPGSLKRRGGEERLSHFVLLHPF